MDSYNNQVQGKQLHINNKAYITYKACNEPNTSLHMHIYLTHNSVQNTRDTRLFGCVHFSISSSNQEIHNTTVSI